MRFYLSIVFYCILSCSVSLGQNSTKSIAEQYAQFMANRHESLFLQLNKQQYLVTETIYFSCFRTLPDATQRAAVMLHLSFYNDKNQRVFTSYHHVSDGLAKGGLNLSLQKGKYIVVATTRDKSGTIISNKAIMPIQVYASAQELRSDDIGLIPTLEVSAEGGRLYAGVSNTISFYISNLEPTRRISSIRLVEENAKVVMEDVQPLYGGHGAIQFRPEIAKTYQLEVFFDDGVVLRKYLPKVIEAQVTFKVNALLNNKVLVSYQKNTPNNSSSSSQEPEAVTVAIHNLQSIQTIDYVLSEQEGTIVIPKPSLAPRFNIISIFDQSKNLLYERFIYNDYGIDEFAPPEATVVSKVKDTVGLFWGNLENLRSASLSLGVSNDYSLTTVPAYSKMLNKYDKFIRISDRYLSGVESRKKAALLDQLALAMGSSELNWQSIFSIHPVKTKEVHNFFSLEGSVNSDVAPNQSITMYQKALGQLYDAQIMSNGAFSIDRIHMIKDAAVYFSIIPAGTGEETIDFTISPNPSDNPVLETNDLLPFQSWLNDTQEALDQPEAFISVKDELALDNVVVTAQKEKETVNVSRNPNLSLAFFEADKIDSKMAKRYTFLSNYIRKLGFKVTIDPITDGLLIASRTILEPPPLLYVDGFRNNGPLRDLPLDNIDEVYYEHNGVEGSSGGTIYIYRKLSFENSNALIKNTATNGFESYTPFQPPFQITGANPTAKILWDPELKIDTGLSAYYFLALEQPVVESTLYAIDQYGFYRVFTQQIQLLQP